MRKLGILNAELAAAINQLGHTDTFAVADCGLPIPSHVPVIDLALVFGIPRFSEVLAALREEVVIQESLVAEESPEEVVALFNGLPLRKESHEELKALLSDVKFVVRTGETTAYANVILTSGVAF
ncbi:D-ribose pyranase [Corynebacterium sp. H128]|uniref:D-ribose pyranase n=1 Tax=unclassified Corynebacterium TaxID=2624378 RepID=UPI003096E4F7